MIEIDKAIDNDPSLAIEMVKCDIQNKQANDELLSFQETGHFAYVHPFAIERRDTECIQQDLLQLKKENPQAFLAEITNLTQNIRRIRSNLNKRKYKDNETRDAWEANLQRAEFRQKILQNIISEEPL